MQALKCGVTPNMLNRISACQQEDWCLPIYIKLVQLMVGFLLSYFVQNV